MGENKETSKDMSIPTLTIKNYPTCMLQSSWLVSERGFGVITNASVYLVTKKDQTFRCPVAPSRFTIVPKGIKTAYNIQSTKCHLAVENSIVMITRATTLKTLSVKNGTIKYTYYVSRKGDKCVIRVDKGTVDLTGSIFDELEIHADGGSVFGFRVTGKLTVYFKTLAHISCKTTKSTLVFKHGDGDISLQDFTLRR